MTIRRGDNVLVLSGKDKGKRGSVERVLTNNKVVIAGVNIMKRHIKPNSKYPSGGIVELTHPIDQSKIMLINPDTDQAARTGSTRTAEGVTRVFKDKKPGKAKKQGK
jgi:large subunit ribosomal protein L24